MLGTMQDGIGGARVGRVKRFEERMHVTLVDGTKARIDGVLRDGEDRLDLVREAIEREIAMRGLTRKPAKAVEKKSSAE